ncbi:GNAT family N-acetyltransferase [Novosphingobium sp. KCTC 2891]|uniref:GNAT family N-acetyltransferase n=1 Tax=Novosphingobium sp. KCTC 2891 TaxID=2989730 RepID=UPI00222199C3|nr:GNAT family N-acetyltransferase [Novosphingobium sp. KCTC 2891]MCW1381696.1 GNAT family N-acetyltransferase [Novosphingobium sp. KCTC 2891]
MGTRVYHAELAEAQADPALAALLGRSDTSAPFDRLDWLALLARECFPGERCFLAVAQDGARIAALPLRQTAWGLEGLANWYSFFVRPRGHDADLLAAIARSLAPMDALRLAPVPSEDAGPLVRALRSSGWIGTTEESDINHFMHFPKNGFEEWWAARPGVLRETVRRKGRREQIALRIAATFSDADWAAYEAVYRLSWKPGEGSPDFLRRFAMAESAAGALRLGIAEHEGVPVAAQFWTVEGNTAWIHKLAHDERARAMSPGTLLSAAMFRHAIERDRVGTIDFGTGADAYKRDWMGTTRPRYQLEFHRPGAPRQWPRLARLAARRLLRRPLVSTRTDG